MLEFEPNTWRRLWVYPGFFKRVDASGHPEAVYHIVNWNYMPPAGSSLIHPHLQVFSTSSAPNLMWTELEASRYYQESRGTNFWEDLVIAEKEAGERYLGKIGRTQWLTAFAPMGVAGDVLRWWRAPLYPGSHPTGFHGYCRRTAQCDGGI